MYNSANHGYIPNGRQGQKIREKNKKTDNPNPFNELACYIMYTENEHIKVRDHVPLA